jgi:hypothetical protein
MAILTDLPAEILVQIMCEFNYVRHVLRLSSACTRTRQVWCDNAAVIASEIFSFPRDELIEIVNLARLEATPPGEALPDILPETSLNEAVHTHTRFLAKLYYGARALVLIANFRSTELYRTISRDPEQQLRYCTRLFYLLLRFVVGYTHPSSLPATYAVLHNLSSTDATFYASLTQKFEMKWPQYGKGLGIENPAREEGCKTVTWLSKAPMPRAWAFGVQMGLCEGYWRPEGWPKPEEERLVEKVWRELGEVYGEERVRIMFGGDAIPWAEERARARRGGG